MAIVFCEKCRKPFQEGHVLFDEYTYCSEECLRADNVGNEDVDGVSLQEMYDNETQYYTEWYQIEPYYSFMEAFEVFDQIHIYEDDAEKVKDEHGNAATRINKKWILIEDDVLETYYKETAPHTFMLESAVLKPGDYKAFNTIEELREAYEELE